MPGLSLAFLLLVGPNCPALVVPPQDMLASTVDDPRDERIAELKAEVEKLKRSLAAKLAEPQPGEWRVYKQNPRYEIYGREIGGVFHYIASRPRPAPVIPGGR